MVIHAWKFVAQQNLQKDALSILAVVASDWSYDYSLIDAHLETYKKANAEIREYLGE